MEIIIGIAVIAFIAVFMDAYEKVSKEQEEKHQQELLEKQQIKEAKLQRKKDYPYYDLIKGVLISLLIMVFIFMCIMVVK